MEERQYNFPMVILLCTGEILPYGVLKFAKQLKVLHENKTKASMIRGVIQILYTV